MKASIARNLMNGVKENSMLSIYIDIRKAAKKGEDHIYVYELLSEPVKTRLCLDGYSIVDVSERNETIIKISWKG